MRLIEPVVGEEELREIQKVLRSGWLTEGPVTQDFEAEIAQFTGAKYAIATTSCTTALELALRALHIGHGDEVIVPDFTHPATADVVSWVGADSVLTDVDIHSYNIDMDKAERAVSPKTKCLIAVSWGGNPLDYRLLKKFKEKHGLNIVEDAACSLGSEFSGRKTGTMADITCFSFHPRKLITTGEGGMITTDNQDLAEKIKCLKNFGMKSARMRTRKNEFRKVGTNYKLSDIQAAMGIAQMRKIGQITNRRIELANSYSELLENVDSIRPPSKDRRAKHVYQTYAPYLEIEGIRDKVIKHLRKENIETQIGTYSLHLQKAFRNSKKVGTLRIAEKLYKNLITLPMCHSMTLEDQKRVVNTITLLIKGKKRRTYGV